MKGTVKIELGGQERELKFETLGIMSAEEELGLSSLTGELFEKFSLRSMVVLTWAALLHSNKKLSIAHVAEWIPFKSMEEEGFASNLMGSLLRAYMLGKGQDPDAVEKKMKEIATKATGDTPEPEPTKEEVSL